MFRLSTFLSKRPTRLKLAITVVAVAVVAAVVLPIYNDHVRRSHRAHARIALLSAAQWMERTAMARGHYPVAAAIPQDVLQVEDGRYTIAAASNDGLTYTLTAMPNMAQATDRCGAYRINQLGTRIQIGTLEVPRPLGPLECWKM
jgi:type IV pilus assembly protein PilE